MAYKLVEYGGKPVLKRSPGKGSWPGAKQVFRQKDSQGQLIKDIVGLREEHIDGAEVLLRKVMESGKITVTLPTLAQSQSILAKELGHLPDETKTIRNPVHYGVEFTPRLIFLREEIERKLVES
jgi:nicotinate phosphoribosyltransferase